MEVPKIIKDKRSIFHFGNNILSSSIVKAPVLNYLRVFPLHRPVFPPQTTGQQPVMSPPQTTGKQPVMSPPSYVPAGQLIRPVNQAPNIRLHMTSRKSLPTMQPMHRPRTPNQPIVDLTSPPAPTRQVVSKATQTSPSIECLCRVDGSERKNEIKIITRRLKHLSQDLKEVTNKPFY